MMKLFDVGQLIEAGELRARAADPLSSEFLNPAKTSLTKRISGFNMFDDRYRLMNSIGTVFQRLLNLGLLMLQTITRHILGMMDAMK